MYTPLRLDSSRDHLPRPLLHLPQTPAELLTGRIDRNQPSQPPVAINAARSFGLPVELHTPATISPTQRLKSNVSNLLKLVLSMFRRVRVISAAVPKPCRRHHVVARLGGLGLQEASQGAQRSTRRSLDGLGWPRLGEARGDSDR